MTTPTPRRSRSRPPSRPTTPLRRSTSRSGAAPATDPDFPLNSLIPLFAELSDSAAILNDNMNDLAAMHDSLSRFNESFASFLYGLNMNAFCVDFPEAPVEGSWERWRERGERAARQRGETEGNVGGTGAAYGGYGGGAATGLGGGRGGFDEGTTFMTTDTSFVNEPPPPTGKHRASTPLKTPARRQPAPRGNGGTRGGRGRPSGLPRGRGGLFGGRS